MANIETSSSEKSEIWVYGFTHQPIVGFGVAIRDSLPEKRKENVHTL